MRPCDHGRTDKRTITQLNKTNHLRVVFSFLIKGH
nr:MAG TPA: hypothetical protein [Caudoviricetes sp.]DAM09718.1 MAG TPA: hypothetical protein [Caudoviricetes sp.]